MLRNPVLSSANKDTGAGSQTMASASSGSLGHRSLVSGVGRLGCSGVVEAAVAGQGVLIGREALTSSEGNGRPGHPGIFDFENQQNDDTDMPPGGAPAAFSGGATATDDHEAIKAKFLPSPSQPTKQEIEEHNITHLPNDPGANIVYVVAAKAMHTS